MAAATVDMSVLTRTFRTALGENAGQFRKASNDNAVNFSKIVKDISAMFKAQRGDIAELTNAVQDSVSESQQTSAKIDSLTSVFRDGLTLQSEMKDYLKTISGNIKILNDSVVNMSNQMVGTGTNSLLSALTNPSNGIANSLKIAGIGAAAGAVGAAAVGSMMGGGGDYKMGAGETASGQQIVSGLMSRGFSKAESSAIAGNIAAESSFKTGITNSIGAYGLMQWLGSRKQQLLEFAKSQNKDSSDLNVQLDFIKKELKGGGRETEAFNRAVSESGGDVSKLAYLFGKYVERPSDAELAQSSSRRVGVATKLFSSTENVTSPSTSASTPQTQTPTTPSTSSAQITPSSKDQEAPPPSATATRYEGPGAESHGPIGKEQHAHKISSEAVTGKSLEGVNPALASAFIAAAEEFKQKTGQTVNINSAVRSTAEQQTLWEKKQRGEISYPVAKPGTSLHEKGLAIDVPAEVAAAMDKSGILAKHGLNRPVAGDPVHIQLMGSRQTEASGPTMQEAGIQQVAATPVSAGIGPGVSAPIPQQAMGMLGGMMPMMGGMGGGIGGIIGSLVPMIGSVLGSLGSMETPAAPQEFASQQNPIAELLQSLSGSAAPGEMMNQAAVQKQAQQEYSQEVAAMPPQPEQRQEVQPSTTTNSMSGGGEGYAYNQPGDIGWPEWASMIGGNHWSELKKFKQNMWG